MRKTRKLHCVFSFQIINTEDSPRKTAISQMLGGVGNGSIASSSNLGSSQSNSSEDGSASPRLSPQPPAIVASSAVMPNSPYSLFFEDNVASVVGVRVGGGGGILKSNSSRESTPELAKSKSIRFADEVRSEAGSSSSTKEEEEDIAIKKEEAVVVDKYFDNLLSMIENAAEGL